MGPDIDDPEVNRLARELAAVTGEPVNTAVQRALEERLHRERVVRSSALRDEIRAIRARCAALPVLDGRTPDEILGYDGTGSPR